MAPEICGLKSSPFKPFPAECWALGVCLFMFVYGRGECANHTGVRRLSTGTDEQALGTWIVCCGSNVTFEQRLVLVGCKARACSASTMSQAPLYLYLRCSAVHGVLYCAAVRAHP
jgi:hypothetical protein